ETGKRLTKPPLIFHVNWFRKSADGKFLWPGYGDNMRVSGCVIDGCAVRVRANESAIGHIPRLQDLDLDELRGVTPNQMRELLNVQTASRETIGSSGFQEREKQQRQSFG